MSLSPDPGARVSFDPAIHDSEVLFDRGSSVIVVKPGVLREYGSHEQFVLKPQVKSL
jgi:hypothetical protein